MIAQQSTESAAGLISGTPNLIGFGSHDEVILVEALDFVGPPVYLHLAPFEPYEGVVIVCFGGFSNFVGQLHGRYPTIEFEGASQTGDAIDLDLLPLRELRH